MEPEDSLLPGVSGRCGQGNAVRFLSELILWASIMVIGILAVPAALFLGAIHLVQAGADRLLRLLE